MLLKADILFLLLITRTSKLLRLLKASILLLSSLPLQLQDLRLLFRNQHRQQLLLLCKHPSRSHSLLPRTLLMEQVHRILQWLQVILIMKRGPALHVVLLISQVLSVLNAALVEARYTLSVIPSEVSMRLMLCLASLKNGFFAGT